MVPTKKYLAYNKGKGEATQQPPTLYKISLLSQSPRSWVFQKSGSSPVTGNNKEQIQTHIPRKKTNLQIINKIQGKVLTQGYMKNLAVALKEGKLMGASDGSVKDGKGSHA